MKKQGFMNGRVFRAVKLCLAVALAVVAVAALIFADVNVRESVKHPASLLFVSADFVRAPEEEEED